MDPAYSIMNRSKTHAIRVKLSYDAFEVVNIDGNAITIKKGRTKSTSQSVLCPDTTKAVYIVKGLGRSNGPRVPCTKLQEGFCAGSVCNFICRSDSYSFNDEGPLFIAGTIQPEREGPLNKEVAKSCLLVLIRLKYREKTMKTIYYNINKSNQFVFFISSSKALCLSYIESCLLLINLLP